MEKYISGSDPGAASEENPKNKLEVIECPEEEPGEFILQKYCKKRNAGKVSLWSELCTVSWKMSGDGFK